MREAIHIMTLHDVGTPGVVRHLPAMATLPQPADGASGVAQRRRTALALAALGIVFGDIGTSPLYTLSTCFQFSGAPPTAGNVTGICSLLVWVLVVVVCFKYVGFILFADHDGEGGILALLALADPKRSRYAPIAAGLLTTVVIAGAAMLLGDGMITPAISVISAIEGLNVITPSAQPYVVPISVVILVGLFALQSKGTEAVGRLFGPVMLLWFAAIALAGALGIAGQPQILWAIDPRHALAFSPGTRSAASSCSAASCSPSPASKRSTQTSRTSAGGRSCAHGTR